MFLCYTSIYENEYKTNTFNAHSFSGIGLSSLQRIYPFIPFVGTPLPETASLHSGESRVVG